MALFGPPSVAGGCYFVWLKGHERALRSLQRASAPAQTFGSVVAGITSLAGAYQLQRMIFVRQFDEGGAFSIDLKKTTESLGEPLKIQTWGQFYRATGPPVFARVGALLVAFYVAGELQTRVANRLSPPPPPPPPRRRKP